MKKMLYFLMLFVIIGFAACSSPESDRDTLRDNGEGLDDFRPPIDEQLDENPKEEEEDCREYKKGGGFSIFGDISPSKWLQNCLAKMIDQSLKPLCDDERQVRDRLAHYESRGDEEAIRVAEEELQAIEDQKYEVADGIYAIADESSYITDELRDKVDDSWGSSDKVGKRIASALGQMVIGSEVSSFTRILDSRARLVCRGQIDLSRIPSRRSD